jgi:hypothetical protein
LGLAESFLSIPKIVEMGGDLILASDRFDDDGCLPSRIVLWKRRLPNGSIEYVSHVAVYPEDQPPYLVHGDYSIGTFKDALLGYLDRCEKHKLGPESTSYFVNRSSF